MDYQTEFILFQYYSATGCAANSDSVETNAFGYATRKCYTAYGRSGHITGSIIFSCSGSVISGMAEATLFFMLHCHDFFMILFFLVDNAGFMLYQSPNCTGINRMTGNSTLNACRNRVANPLSGNRSGIDVSFQAMCAVAGPTGLPSMPYQSVTVRLNFHCLKVG